MKLSSLTSVGDPLWRRLFPALVENFFNLQRCTDLLASCGNRGLNSSPASNCR